MNISMSFGAEDAAHKAKLLREYGFDGIDLRLGDYILPDCMSEGTVRQLLAAVDNCVNIFTEVFSRTGERFVFILDEWDAVFYMPFVKQEGRESYLRFLKALLKDQPYVELAYMTGILPIAKYSDGSELNMFWEYNMATKERFGEYFGFTEAEVDMLFARYVQNVRNILLTSLSATVRLSELLQAVKREVEVSSCKNPLQTTISGVKIFLLYQFENQRKNS